MHPPVCPWPRPTIVLVGLLLGLVVPVAHGQSSYDLFGSARASAMGYATTGLADDVGVHANPAARSAVARRVTVFFARQSFGVSELRYGAAHHTEPTPWGSVSLGAGTFGFDAYREVHLNVGVARGLALGTTRRLHVGLNARYYHTSISEYGSAGALGLNAGVLVNVLYTLDFGVHATNLNAPALVSDEALPQTLSAGLSYRPENRLRIVADVFKDLDFPLSLRGGIELHPVPVLALRAGVATAPVRFTAGAGVVVDRLRADVAAEQHPDLGWSPSASLGVAW